MVENLSQHIENLLVRHDYVVVPDLGGFVIQHQSAKVFNDLITAPRSTIGFNQLMQHGDGLLAIEISRSEQISYRQAMNFVQNEVETLKSDLKFEEQIQMGSIGYLKLNDAGNILFLPDKKVDFLPQNFGLDDLFVSAKELKTGVKRREITIQLPSRRIYKYAAVVLLMLGLFLVSEKVSDVRVSDYASLIPKMTDKTVDKRVEVKTISILSETEPQVEKAIPEIIKDYHVIVASLATKESAVTFCNELIASDFKEAHVLEPIKTYRIAIKSFSDKDEAIQYMENLRKSDLKFETAWVLCN